MILRFELFLVAFFLKLSLKLIGHLLQGNIFSPITFQGENELAAVAEVSVVLQVTGQLHSDSLANAEA